MSNRFITHVSKIKSAFSYLLCGFLLLLKSVFIDVVNSSRKRKKKRKKRFTDVVLFKKSELYSVFCIAFWIPTGEKKKGWRKKKIIMLFFFFFPFHLTLSCVGSYTLIVFGSRFPPEISVLPHMFFFFVLFCLVQISTSKLTWYLFSFFPFNLCYVFQALQCYPNYRSATKAILSWSWHRQWSYMAPMWRSRGQMYWGKWQCQVFSSYLFIYALEERVLLALVIADSYWMRSLFWSQLRPLSLYM